MGRGVRIRLFGGGGRSGCCSESASIERTEEAVETRLLELASLFVRDVAGVTVIVVVVVVPSELLMAGTKQNGGDEEEKGTTRRSIRVRAFDDLLPYRMACPYALLAAHPIKPQSLTARLSHKKAAPGRRGVMLEDLYRPVDNEKGHCTGLIGGRISMGLRGEF